MQLTIKERIILPGILPQKGSADDMRKVVDIANSVDFSDAEIKDLKIVRNLAGDWSWDPAKKKQLFEIKFKPAEQAMIISALNKMDSDKSLTPEVVSLYVKFIAKDGEVV